MCFTNPGLFNTGIWQESCQWVEPQLLSSLDCPKILWIKLHFHHSILTKIVNMKGVIVHFPSWHFINSVQYGTKKVWLVAFYGLYLVWFQKTLTLYQTTLGLNARTPRVTKVNTGRCIGAPWYSSWHLLKTKSASFETDVNMSCSLLVFILNWMIDHISICFPAIVLSALHN